MASYVGTDFGSTFTDLVVVSGDGALDVIKCHMDRSPENRFLQDRSVVHRFGAAGFGLGFDIQDAVITCRKERSKTPRRSTLGLRRQVRHRAASPHARCGSAPWQRVKRPRTCLRSRTTRVLDELQVVAEVISHNVDKRQFVDERIAALRAHG